MAQDRALGLGEQLVAPIERRPQCLLPRQSRPPATGEQVETIIEPRRELLDTKGCGARRGKLDRQWHAVKPPTNGGDRVRNVSVGRETWLRRLRALDEQLNCAILQRVRGPWVTFCRHSERRYKVDPLPLYSQRLTAGGDHTCCRIGAQQRFSHVRRRVEHMLAIIEH